MRTWNACLAKLEVKTYFQVFIYFLNMYFTCLKHMELYSLRSDLCPIYRTLAFSIAVDNETSVRPLERVSCKYKNSVFKGCVCPTRSVSWLITWKTTHNGALLCALHNIAIHHHGHWPYIWHFPVWTVISETWKRQRLNLKLKQTKWSPHQICIELWMQIRLKSNTRSQCNEVHTNPERRRTFLTFSWVSSFFSTGNQLSTSNLRVRLINCWCLVTVCTNSSIIWAWRLIFLSLACSLALMPQSLQWSQQHITQRQLLKHQKWNHQEYHYILDLL